MPAKDNRGPRRGSGARPEPGDPVAAWAFRSQPPATIWIEYTQGGRRLCKRFDDVAEAQRFYALKAKQGRDPRVFRVAL